MSDLSADNAHSADPDSANSADIPSGEVNIDQQAPSAQRKRTPKRKGPKYAEIHSKPLPLEVHPLPAFHPSHPTSLLRLAYVWLSQLLSPPSSHPLPRYIGYYSYKTRSVHVTDPEHARALWEMGFFGKGTLSRSEPSWLEREKARRKARLEGGGTAEEATIARREERRLFKLERARVEGERIERQRLVEEVKLLHKDADAVDGGEGIMTDAAPCTFPAMSHSDADQVIGTLDDTVERSRTNNGVVEGRVPDAELIASADAPNGDLQQDTAAPEGHIPEKPFAGDDETPIQDQEHLQLTLEEAFFLSYGLGALDIQHSPCLSPKQAGATQCMISNIQLLTIFRQCSSFPPGSLASLAPDDPFLLNYVTYHHFRSLGWAVRPGVKFAVDYLLYNRGPVFSHAEFAVIIMPSYSAPYWSTEAGKHMRRAKVQKDWWWLHCVNRVQSHVKKSLVLCYVDVPAPSTHGQEEDIGKLLRSYCVREFIVRRWLANRSRG